MNLDNVLFGFISVNVTFVFPCSPHHPLRPTGGLAPHGLGYDRRNNIMWGWDPVLKKVNASQAYVGLALVKFVALHSGEPATVS